MVLRIPTFALLGTLPCLVLACAGNISGDDSGHEARFLEPESLEVLSGNVVVRVWVSPMEDLEEVTIEADEIVANRWRPQLKRSDVPIDTALFYEGATRLRLRARWQDGTVLEDTVATRIDNGDPLLDLAHPAVGSVHFVEDGVLPVQAVVRDGIGIARAEVRANGELIAEMDPVVRNDLMAALDPTDYHPGTKDTETSVTLTVTVWDREGHSTSTETTLELRSRRMGSIPVVGRVETPALALPDGSVALVTTQGWLYLFEADGTERCRFQASDEVGLSGPVLAVAGRSILWGTTRALRSSWVSDCSTRWTHPTMSQWWAQPIVGSDGTIYATTFDGVLHATSTHGIPLWNRALSAPGTASPPEAVAATALLPDGTVLQGLETGIRDGALIALWPNGSPRWTVATPAIRGGILVTESALYFGASDGRLYKLDHEGQRAWDGEPLLSEARDVLCTPALLPNGNIAVCDGGGLVHAFRSADGAKAWEYDTRGPGVGAGAFGRGGVVVASDGTLYVADVLGSLHAIDGDGQLRFNAKLSDEELLAPPLLLGNVLVAPGVDNQVHFLWAGQGA